MSKRRHDDDNPQLDTSCKTILDILNADCWRHVLDYVDINDVVRSERVSRGWQQVVLGYLPGVKSYRVNHIIPRMCGTYQHYSNEHKYRCIHLKWGETMSQSMMKKMGPYIEKLLLYYTNLMRLSPSFGTHCPNIKDITFYGIRYEIPLEALTFFKPLKKVTFESCTGLSEFYMDGFIHKEYIEHVKILESEHMSGKFLAAAGKNLKSLTLTACPLLKIEGLDQSEDFSRLTELVLNFNSPEIIEKVSHLIRKTPKLEILSLDGYKGVSVPEELVAAIGRLGELQRFSMSGIATDALLDAIANGCEKLRYLNVNGSRAVSGRAVRALCRELPCISELCVAGSQVADEDLAHCISFGSITALDVSFCSRVSPALVAAAARDVRRRPRRLLLRLHGTASDTNQELYVQEKRLGLTLTWRPVIYVEFDYYRGYRYRPTYVCFSPMKWHFSPVKHDDKKEILSCDFPCLDIRVKPGTAHHLWCHHYNHSVF